MYQEHFARVLQGVGCPDKIDFGRWMRDEGGRHLRDAQERFLERQGWLELSRDQLQLLTAKLGACSNVRTIDLSGERCSVASDDGVGIQCFILLHVIVFRVQDWKRRLRCACWGAARALCIAEHLSLWYMRDILSWCGVWVCIFESLLIGGLFSDCKIKSEGWVALFWALQGLSALQSIDLSCA